MVQTVNILKEGVQVGQKEDLDDSLHEVALDMQPGLAVIPEGEKPISSSPEWTHITVRATGVASPVKEGEKVEAKAARNATRVKSHTQIQQVSKAVSHTAMATEVAGSLQDLDKQLELDLIEEWEAGEATGFSRQRSASETDNASGRLMAGLGSTITTNVDRKPLASNDTGRGGGYNSGTGRTNAVNSGLAQSVDVDKVEVMIKDVNKAGGKPTHILMSYEVQLQLARGNLGSAVRHVNLTADGAGNMTQNNAVDTLRGAVGNPVQYVGLPRHQTYDSADGDPVKVSDLFVLSDTYVERVYLRPWDRWDLGREGASERAFYEAEWCIKWLAENAHGVIEFRDTAA